MRRLERALRRLEGTMFEPPEVLMPVQHRDAYEVPTVWLILVIEALGEFIHSDDWLPK